MELLISMEESIDESADRFVVMIRIEDGGFRGGDDFDS